jgi:endogenous inhibitor of DNA gyrase (YacG/DUF329 family)
MTKTVACPVCSAAVPWTEASSFRPFCSERCRMIDLGDWAAERHVIPGSPVDPTDPANQSPGDNIKH